MSPRIQAYLESPMPLAYASERRSDGTIVVAIWPVQFPGCVGMGATIEEARDDLRSALQVYLEAMEERGVEAPDPVPYPAVTVGQVTIYRASDFEDSPVHSQPGGAPQSETRTGVRELIDV